jgi:hypothetical protein
MTQNHSSGIIMNHQPMENRMRPSLPVLGACFAAIFLAGFGMGRMGKQAPAASSPLAEAPGNAAPAASEQRPAARSVTPAVASAAPAAPAPPQLVTMERLGTLWGFQVSSIGLAMDGAALSVSYTVLEPDKATLLSDDAIPALLIEQASGRQILLKVSSPMGVVSSHSRARSQALAGLQSWSFPPPRNKLFAGQEYSFLVSNPENTVKSGSKLALVVGNYKTSPLTVQ